MNFPIRRDQCIARHPRVCLQRHDSARRNSRLFGRRPFARVAEIREMGRATQGVTLINVDEGTELSGLQRIAESDDDEGDDSIGDAGENSEGQGAEGGEPENV